MRHFITEGIKAFKNNGLQTIKVHHYGERISAHRLSRKNAFCVRRRDTFTDAQLLENKQRNYYQKESIK